MAENLGPGPDFANIGTHDFYAGERGLDTLQLALTYGEFQLASVQKDIADYQAFLAYHANPGSDGGPTFQFASFDLDARGFEALAIQLVNTAPTANDDAGATNEDTPLMVLAAGVLADDTDPDHLDQLTVVGFDTVSAKGAAVLVNANGSYTYNPTGALALQMLAAGESVTDSFGYRIADLAGATDTATVRLLVTGVNDAPVITSDGGGVSATVSVPENTTFVTDVDANDIDTPPGSLTFSKSGVDAGFFTISSTTGVLSFTSPPDFETPLDTGLNNIYNVDVQVSDGLGGSDTQSIAVTVTKALFTGNADTVDFNAVVAGTYVAGTQYDALGGDDIVTLPADNNAADTAGYDPAQTFLGGAGNDTITGGGLDDIIDGGTGNDTLDGGAGNDTLIGGPGVDLLFSAGANSTLIGGEGDDLLASSGDNSTLYGGPGDDQLFSAGANSTLIGGEGDDLLASLGLINSMLDGGLGVDTLIGGDGKDTLVGGLGDDTLVGGLGDDTLIGGDGKDTLVGGTGDDVFKYSFNLSSTTVTSGDGFDTIVDFGNGADKVRFDFTAAANWDASLVTMADKLNFLQDFFTVGQVDTNGDTTLDSTRIQFTAEVATAETTDDTWSVTLEGVLLAPANVLAALDIYVNDVLIG